MVDFLTYDFGPNRSESIVWEEEKLWYNDFVVVYENAVMNLLEFKIKLSSFEVLTMVYDVWKYKQLELFPSYVLK